MTRGVRGRAVLLAVALMVTWVASLAGPATDARADVTAQGCSARAVVVVEPGPGAVTICFDGSISGLDALQLAVGADNVTTYGFSGQGAAVCAINGVGNPADSSCLVGPGSQYWAYYRAAPGAGGWTYSRGGASTTTVTDGSVEGWRYGTGAAPGFVSFCAVVGCAPPPTDPPPVTQAPPPVTSPPAVGPSTPTPAADGSTATPTTSAGKDSGKTKGDGGAADSGEAATADGKGDKDSKAGSTTTTRKSGTTASDRRQRSGTAEVASGGTGGGSDGGSPVGVIVAVAVVAIAVAGGLLIRRRRGGPAPG